MALTPESFRAALMEPLSPEFTATVLEALDRFGLQLLDLRTRPAPDAGSVGTPLDQIHADDRALVSEARGDVLSGTSDVTRVSFRKQSQFEDFPDEARWCWMMGTYAAVVRDGALRFIIAQELDTADCDGDPAVWPPGCSEVDRRANEAETLRMAAHAVASELDLSRTIRVVLDQASTVVPYDTAAVELLREDGLEIVDGIGWLRPEDVKGARIPVPGDNPHTEAIQQQRPVLLRNAGERYSAFFSSGHATGTRSWMGLPLVVHGSVLGLLALKSRTAGFFTADHLRLATTFADHVAVAISNAQLHEQTRRLAMTDTLTGALTRRAFFPDAERLIRQSLRYHHPLCVLMIDLDEFKGINDRYGHVVGDDVLRAVGSAIQSVVRASDLVCRFGGDEFVLLMPETRLPVARDIAERLRSTVSRSRVPACPIPVTASIGVAAFRADDTLTALIARADAALYQSKQSGRNRVVVAQGVAAGAVD